MTLKLTITNALRIPGRGTVLVAETINGAGGHIAVGQTLNVDTHHVLIRAVERHGPDSKRTGLVLADALMPADLQLPANATIHVADE